MNHIHIIRHGQASFGAEDYDQLSALGQRQSRILGRFWSTQGLVPDKVYSGTLTRQAQTAELVLAELSGNPGVDVLPGLDEFDFESMMRTLLPIMVHEEPELGPALDRFPEDPEVFFPIFMKAALRWAEGRDPLPRAETWPAFKTRVIDALDSIAENLETGQNAVVFTSGGPLAVMMKTVLGLNDRTGLGLTWMTRNTSVTTFGWDGGKYHLVQYSAIGHLEAEADPDLITHR